MGHVQQLGLINTRKHWHNRRLKQVLAWVGLVNGQHHNKNILTKFWSTNQVVKSRNFHTEDLRCVRDDGHWRWGRYLLFITSSPPHSTSISQFQHIKRQHLMLNSNFQAMTLPREFVRSFTLHKGNYKTSRDS